MSSNKLQIRDSLKESYNDVYTESALGALGTLLHFNDDIKQVMDSRIKRRAARQKNQERIAFLDPQSLIPRTRIKVQDARDGKFEGSVIPADLQRQWIQGTGPAAKPNAPLENSIRNVAYALLSGENAVVIVDTRTGDTIRVLPTGRYPLGLALRR